MKHLSSRGSSGNLGAMIVICSQATCSCSNRNVSCYLVEKGEDNKVLFTNTVSGTKISFDLFIVKNMLKQNRLKLEEKRFSSRAMSRLSCFLL